MTFVESTTPDITEGIPTPLSTALEASQAASSQGAKFDVYIGGVGFTLTASDQHPYVRQTAPVQKQQLDTSKESGEQTLDGDWVRSQTSWHHGAGVRFYDPGSDPATQYRFEESHAVDVFTRDKVTLLKKTTKIGAVSGGQFAYVTGAVVGGVDVVFTNENGAVKRRLGDGTAAASYTGAFSTSVTRIACSGAKIYSGMTFGISSADANGSTFSSLYTQGLGSSPVPYWAKARLIATKGPNLYELAPDGSSGSTPGNLDTVTPLYTHPDTGWTWSSVVEAPSAILAAGYSNGRTAAYRFSLQDAASGSTPELSQAYQVIDLPIGEEILSLYVHLGRYIGIGTTKGIRVGVLTDTAEVQWGPLLVECGPVRDITATDRFLYGAVTAAQSDGKSGAVVVDLSEEVEENSLRFPYSWHARTGTTGQVDNVAVLGASGRLAFATYGEGVYLQSATDHEAEGWVRSGRVRYATAEFKKFTTADVGALLPDGAVGLYVVDADDDETYIRNLTPEHSDGRAIALANGARGVYEYLRFRLSLTASSDALTSPTLDSLQIRAIPVPHRKELIQYPLLCQDREQTATGVKYGREGYGFQRFAAVKSLEETMAIVTVRDTTTGETFQAQVESVEFRRPGPRAADGRPNFGGLLTVVVRK